MSRKIDTTTPPSLVLKLRDHADGAAWSEFVDVYSPLIYDFCRAHQLQASDAADVTQEALVRVARAIRTFEYDRQKGLFRDWLARIVLNEIRRLLKKQSRLAAVSEELDHDAGRLESTWNEQFQAYIFNKALERTKPHFSPETWCMFEMSWLRKIPTEEVASELKVSVNHVYVARSRVLKRLRYEVAILADDIL